MKINTLKQTIVALLLIVATTLTAKEITQQQAQIVAQQFLTNHTNTTLRKQAPATTLSHRYTQLHTDGTTPLYHIFNQAENGFIIVAGDDNIAPIIGYSDNGTFDPNNLPDNFKAFLECCNQTIETTLKYNKKHNVQNIEEQEETGEENFAPFIEPLLGEICFTQSAPFNNLCPQQNGVNTAVGCVAVSVGQVMAYYQYPTKGTGSNTYTTSSYKIKLSVNFGETTYNWDNILPTYRKGAYTEEQAEEVAKMLFHCGVATNMDYGVGFSGSNNTYAMIALTSYFGYDKNIRLENRAQYSQTQWENLIKKELNQNRPIIYSGISAISGGHAFNCDGYDENDMFHINWGWGGYCNGYFSLRLLESDITNPEEQHAGYALRQNMVIGIQPATENSTSQLKHQIELKDGLYYEEETDEISFECCNYGLKSFSGEIALGIYDQENNYIGICDESKEQVTLGILRTKIYKINGSKIPTQPKDYRLAPYYKANDSTEWLPIPGGPNMPPALIFDYNEDSTAITLQNLEQFEESPLQVLSLKPIGNVYQKRTARFAAKVKNISDTEYYGPIVVYMVNYDKDNEKIMSEDFPVTLKSGEEAEYEIQIENVNTSVGDYYCYIAYDSYDSYWTTIYGEYYDSPDVDFSVLAAPTEEAQVTLTQSLSFQNTTTTTFNNTDTPILTATITNKSGYAQINVAAVILDGNKKPIYSFATKKLMLDQDETADISYLCDFIELSNGKHYLNLQYYDPFAETPKWKMLTPTNKNLLQFTISNGETSATQNTEQTNTIIYPTKTKDFINLTAEEEILNATIYSITGVEIKTIDLNTNTATIDLQNLAAGIYLVTINTTNYTETVKIIKE